MSAGLIDRVSFRRPEQVPSIAGNVEKDGDLTVGFGARRAHQGAARFRHPLIRSVEVTDAEEEADPSGHLVADGCALVFSVSTSEQDPGARARRSDDHPPLGPPIVGQR